MQQAGTVGAPAALEDAGLEANRRPPFQRVAFCAAAVWRRCAICAVGGAAGPVGAILLRVVRRGRAVLRIRHQLHLHIVPAEYQSVPKSWLER